MTPASARCRALIVALLALAGCGREAAPETAIGFAPQPLFEQVGEATVANETRAALVLQAPEHAMRRRQVVVPPGARLEFGFGVPNLVADAAAPTQFEVAVEPEAGARAVLVRATLDAGDPPTRRWVDHVADLAPWDGQRVALVFRVTAEGKDGAVGAISLPVLVGGRAPTERPNLMIVSLDTLRARNVSAYGYARETTPFLDGFARRGALFEDAITTSVTTAPSHMSVFTGRYPVNHGVRLGSEPKARGAATLAEWLRASGYHTAAFTENGYLLRERGFGEGFLEYTENKGVTSRAPGEVRVTFTQAARWIGERAREPFFAFVHTYQVHSPYQPPPGYRALYEDDAVAGPEAPAMRALRDAYDREIRFVDDELRGLVGALEAAGILERTLVVVLSDHGEEFQEHGFFQHGGAVFEESLRVPLVFVGPGVPPGRRVSGTVSLIDVLPTTLELLGLPRPPGIDGTSLVAALRGEAPLADRALFAEAFAPRRWRAPMLQESWNPPLVAVRAPEGKFIVHRPKQGEALPPRRYDLERDALEQDPQPLEGAQRARVEAWVDGYLKGRLAPHEVPEAQPFDAETEERLRALGYL